MPVDLGKIRALLASVAGFTLPLSAARVDFSVAATAMSDLADGAFNV